MSPRIVSPFYGYFVCANPGRQIYIGGMFIEISDSIYGTSRKAKIIHVPKHTVMVSVCVCKIQLEWC